MEQSLTSETKGDFMGALYLGNSATSMKHSEEGSSNGKEERSRHTSQGLSWAVISEEMKSI